MALFSSSMVKLSSGIWNSRPLLLLGPLSPTVSSLKYQRPSTLRKYRPQIRSMKGRFNCSTLIPRGMSVVINIVLRKGVVRCSSEYVSGENFIRAGRVA